MSGSGSELDSGSDLDNDMLEIRCEDCDEVYEFCDQLDKCDICTHNDNAECNLCPHCGVRLSLFPGSINCSDAIICDITLGHLYYCFHPEHKHSKWLMYSDTKHILDHGSRIVRDPDTLILLLAIENPVMKGIFNDRMELGMDLNRRISRINNPAVMGTGSTRFLNRLFPTLPDLQQK